MSEQEGASAEAPPLVIRKTFEVWSNLDNSNADMKLSDIIGSRIDDGMLYLYREDGIEFFVNLKNVAFVRIESQP